MNSFKTQGIIIKRTNLGEADRILTIYTKDYGKIKVVAKGIRKVKSKLAGSLELFCLDDLIVTKGKNLDIVTSAVTKKCFFNLRSNLTKTNTAYYLSELVEKMMPENEAHEDVFELFDEVLENLDSGKDPLLLAYFELNFLSAIGFRPELHSCLKCSEKIKVNQKTRFDSESGGLVCFDCAKLGQNISDDAIKMLRLLLEKKLSVIKKMNLKKELEKEIITLTRNYLKNVYQDTIKSERYLNENWNN